MWALSLHFVTTERLLLSIGGHLLRYPWSAISDWAWYRNFRYRTEESGVRHYIGYRNKLLSDIRHPKIHKSAQWLRKQVSLVRILLMWLIFIGYRNGLGCRYHRNDSYQSDIFSSDIGITDVDIGCRISPIIEVDVDAHLCYWENTRPSYLHNWAISSQFWAMEYCLPSKLSHNISTILGHGLSTSEPIHLHNWTNIALKLGRGTYPLPSWQISTTEPPHVHNTGPWHINYLANTL